MQKRKQNFSLKNATKCCVSVFSKKTHDYNILIEPVEILGDNENIMIVHIRDPANPQFFKRTVWRRIDE